jgi:hypothetical protein
VIEIPLHGKPRATVVFIQRECDCRSATLKEKKPTIYIKSSLSAVYALGVKMTDLFSPFSAPTPSHPSPVNHFFRSSASGRDSPRTLVMAEEILKLHIGTPPIPQDDFKSFTLEIPPGKARKRPYRDENQSVGDKRASSPPDPLFGISPTKRRSPGKVTPTLLSPLEEMDIREDPLSPTHRSQSPPPSDLSSDSDDDMCELHPPDERTRYLRQKKRAEQVTAYRMRELKDDRESRISKRSNPLSPKSTKITKQCIKKVKFAL